MRKTTKVIESFDDCLDYVIHIGFDNSKNCMAYRQSALCSVCDWLLRTSGQTSWYQETFVPFGVRFHRYTDDNTGFSYPWLSSFTVESVITHNAEWHNIPRNIP